MKTTRKSYLLLLAALVVALVVALAACASQGGTGSSDKGSSQPQATQKAAQKAEEGGAFVSDEQCLSCHGGSYEALADSTKSLGDWNPHDSIHGGYNSCVNCHAKDKELTHNYCADCHAYKPDKK